MEQSVWTVFCWLQWDCGSEKYPASIALGRTALARHRRACRTTLHSGWLSFINKPRRLRLQKRRFGDVRHRNCFCESQRSSMTPTKAGIGREYWQSPKTLRIRNRQGRGVLRLLEDCTHDLLCDQDFTQPRQAHFCSKALCSTGTFGKDTVRRPSATRLQGFLPT